MAVVNQDSSPKGTDGSENVKRINFHRVLVLLAIICWILFGILRIPTGIACFKAAFSEAAEDRPLNIVEGILEIGISVPLILFGLVSMRGSTRAILAVEILSSVGGTIIVSLVAWNFVNPIGDVYGLWKGLPEGSGEIVRHSFPFLAMTFVGLGLVLGNFFLLERYRRGLNRLA